MVANPVAGFEDGPGVAVGVAVFADATVTGEIVGGGEKFGGSEGVKEGCTGSEKRGAEEVAAGDRGVHAKRRVARKAVGTVLCHFRSTL